METGCLGEKSHHFIFCGLAQWLCICSGCVYVCARTFISLLSLFFPYFLSPSHTHALKCPFFFLLSLPMFCVFSYSVSDHPLSVFLSRHRCCLWVQMCCRSTSCRLLASTSGRCCTTAPSRRCGTGSSCCWSSTPPSWLPTQPHSSSTITWVLI